jgi:hypothetical protein
VLQGNKLLCQCREILVGAPSPRPTNWPAGRIGTAPADGTEKDSGIAPEKGTNRIGASRLQQIGHILQVPVSFFFEDLPLPSEALSEEGAYIDDFLATSGGLSLTKYFMCIKDPKLRRCVVDLVEHIA